MLNALVGLLFPSKEVRRMWWWWNLGKGGQWQQPKYHQNSVNLVICILWRGPVAASGHSLLACPNGHIWWMNWGHSRTTSKGGKSSLNKYLVWAALFLLSSPNPPYWSGHLPAIWMATSGLHHLGGGVSGCSGALSLGAPLFIWPGSMIVFFYGCLCLFLSAVSPCLTGALHFFFLKIKCLNHCHFPSQFLDFSEDLGIASGLQKYPTSLKIASFCRFCDLYW